jgi:hypothetical protein
LSFLRRLPVQCGEDFLSIPQGQFGVKTSEWNIRKGTSEGNTRRQTIHLVVLLSSLRSQYHPNYNNNSNSNHSPCYRRDRDSPATAGTETALLT